MAMAVGTGGGEWLGGGLGGVGSGFMTDNGPWNNAAWIELDKKNVFPNTVHLRCWAHIVNRVCKDLCASRCFTKAVKLAQCITATFKGKARHYAKKVTTSLSQSMKPQICSHGTKKKPPL